MEDEFVVVHVRFAPDGDVTEISERPAAASPQVWFDRLSRDAAPTYRPLSGGRGAFRIARDRLDALKAGAPG